MGARLRRMGRWQVATERLIEQLRGLATVDAGIASFAELTSLPAPVQRYFRTVLRDGQPLIVSAELAQTGEFRSQESPDPEAGWQPFQATQLFTAEPPGFVWDARIRMGPLASVRVRDAYVGGHASMLGAVLGIVRVVEAADGPQLRAGALQRYLAEAVWLPTALLPRGGLRWTPIDDAHARATLTDGETTATLEFEFGTNGEIVGCYTPGRQRAAAGESNRYHTLPWGGRYRRYEERAGVRVPFESEVYWVVDGMEQPYYRGRNLQFTFDFGGRD
jgi:hypothetical protein